MGGFFYLPSFETIITELYLSDQVDDCIRKLVPERYRGDFKQELFLNLCDKKDSVIDAHENGKLVFYTVRVILRMMSQTRARFHKTFIEPETKTTPLTINDPCDESYEAFEVRKLREEDEVKYIDKLKVMKLCGKNHYYARLAEALEKHKTYREVGRQLGIPVSSISEMFKKLRKLLQE